MLKLNRTHLFWAKVWLCTGAGVTVAIILYAALIHPSILLVSQRDEAIQERSSVEQDYQQAVSAFESIQARIEDKARRLEALGGSPPLETREDIIVTTLTNLAVADGLSIDQFIPLESLDAENHRAFFVQFTARGEFTALHRYLKRIESQVDFVDITHLSVSRSPQREDTACLIQWSCRINTQRLSEQHGRGPAMDGAVALQRATGEGRHAR